MQPRLDVRRRARCAAGAAAPAGIAVATGDIEGGDGKAHGAGYGWEDERPAGVNEGGLSCKLADMQQREELLPHRNHLQPRFAINVTACLLIGRMHDRPYARMSTIAHGSVQPDERGDAHGRDCVGACL